MAVVTGGSTINIAITQVGQIGIAPNTPLPGGNLNLRSQFANASAADGFTLLYAATLNFLASTPITIDLTSLLDQVGNSIGFAAVRYFARRIQSTNPAFVITAGNAGADEWNGLLTSGSKQVWYPSTAVNDGFTVVQAPTATGMPVNSGSKLFKMDPGANAVGLVDLIIAGS